MFPSSLNQSPLNRCRVGQACLGEACQAYGGPHENLQQRLQYSHTTRSTFERLRRQYPRSAVGQLPLEMLLFHELLA